jgi:hypothetical protein
MKPEIIYYSGYEIHYIAVIKNGFVIDIACSEKHGKGAMYSEKDRREYIHTKKAQVKVKAQDLALYTHWPIHTKEFWDLLNET